jgi:hypothetical protein
VSPGQVDALAEWLRCGTEFAEFVSTLDREEVNQGAWNGHTVPASGGLAYDGKLYLRAAGVAAARFSTIANSFVRRHCHGTFGAGLRFSVEAGEPVSASTIAILRIQSPGGAAVGTSGEFVGIGARQEYSEYLLYGSEARIVLATPTPDYKADGPHQMVAGVRLTYDVVGQDALKVFASVLRRGLVQQLWPHAPFEIATRILLTRGGEHDSIDESWVTSDDPHGKRLLKFCTAASKLTSDETPDWPPYLTLSADLDGTNAESDLEQLFGALCAHVRCLEGDSGGWNERFARAKQADPEGWAALMGKGGSGR